MAETLEGMTGLERLRELAGGLADESLWGVLPESREAKWGAEDGGRSLADELRDVAGMIERERALPQGVEWPRFEDGEPVRLGDAFAGRTGSEGVVRRIVFGKHVARIESEDGASIALGCGERVKRPSDTQERIDSDALKPGIDYWGCRDVDRSLCPGTVGGEKPWERYGTIDCDDAKTLDLLRRQRELDAREGAPGGEESR